MGDMVDHLFPPLKHVKHILLRNKWPSQHRIANISTPILFFMSEKDELVPYAHMDNLYISSTKTRFKHKVLFF
jgi:predicted alpha/beta hydrolase